jgi:hypothetical protein
MAYYSATGTKGTEGNEGGKDREVKGGEILEGRIIPKGKKGKGAGRGGKGRG